MIAYISIAIAALASVAIADNRVFGGLGNSACQACLATVEAACKGPITSSQFNDCFCDADGDAWAALENCLTVETDCDPQRESVLGYYGAHCFAWKDDAEEEFCVDASQDDELKMSVADSFCDEFITLSSSSKPTTTTTTTTVTEEESSEQTTESRPETSEPETITSAQETTSAATSATEAQQTTSPDLPSSTSTTDEVAPTKSESKTTSGESSSDDDEGNSNDRGSSNDDNNAGSNLTSLDVPGLVALALWAGYMLSS
ncbi:hypothetical protein B0J13DRAFT_521328 [Dactylonectria estremocensis]|uniref:Extracellular membrane protein CFEM domain-containing protein n=1 Tax=Dactylonectria estremocensis TaxID=1079267 RepID=A0A9P9F848_9HYPO|nr:hypothetical protein B0J13DRAFT_521328 [Dactylonectria estremocensis]